MTAFSHDKLGSVLVIADDGSLERQGSEFVRYLFAGGSAFILDFGLLYLLTQIGGLHYLTSAAIAFTAGLVWVYFLSVRWVFGTRRLASRQTEFTLFALIGIVGLGFNELFMWLQTDLMHFHYLVSKVGTAATVLTWNFAARKLLLFT